ncbi:hypothetical protein PVAG01_06249 [Phlyctema vagabunda]|uniref:Zn(2)-C6 fungal-type domain-containing protein n=1 Tax=Phlyctema vagabunda TaxID=108571 RepID=A0ABR4PFN5_9HELO
MSEMPLSGPDRSVGLDLLCELCSKPYQRRDLLMRHRRRCQGPRKPIHRRKACDSCVQAKAKCCYTQPTCTRCANRGTECVYIAPVASAVDHLGHPGDVAGISHSDPRASSAPIGDAESSGPIFDLELPTWDFSANPYSLNSFDPTQADLSDVPLLGFNAPQSPSNQEAVVPASSTQMRFISSSSKAPLAISSNGSTGSTPAPQTSSISFKLASVLSEYPSLLIKDSFLSPFPHLAMYSLYDNIGPDMSLLPLTSMAICCGAGIHASSGKQFFRRAMEAARQRLIGCFPENQCMQQWDALHAMLIYESLELRATIADEPENWKQNPRVKGLGSPFLLKMAHCYRKEYPAIRNFDINVFSESFSIPCTAAKTAWERWKFTETARRTIFFANILNFFGNRNLYTATQSSFYESLDDDLILNMPLPCNDNLWVARDEESWNLAVRSQPPSVNESSFGSSYLETEALSSPMNLKTIFTRFTKESIQVELGTSFGFNNSVELRHLIVLCASEQFV